MHDAWLMIGVGGVVFFTLGIYLWTEMEIGGPAHPYDTSPNWGWWVGWAVVDAVIWVVSFVRRRKKLFAVLTVAGVAALVTLVDLPVWLFCVLGVMCGGIMRLATRTHSSSIRGSTE